MFKIKSILLTATLLTLLLYGLLMLCSNNPWPENFTDDTETLFIPEVTEWKTLDPLNAGYVHEATLNSQFLESFFTYHYLKRPYELIPALAEEIPQLIYYDADGKKIEEDDPPHDKVKRMEITIRIKKGVKYQPHPAFARNASGDLLYHDLTPNDVRHISTPNDFEVKGTQEVTAQDFAIQARRLCDIRYSTVHYSTFTNYILGMKSCSDQISEYIQNEYKKNPRRSTDDPIAVDYMKISLSGVEVLDTYTIRYSCKQKYPQMLYWMAMGMFSPLPQEVVNFYAQQPLAEKSITYQNWPVGTGPYYLQEFNASRRAVLVKNPNFRDVYYPSEGEAGDSELGLLADAGKKLPMNERLVFNLEKESIPAWVKFLQGYYENGAISNDMFDKAITTNASGDMNLSDEMSEKGISMLTSNDLTIWYLAFNMEDKKIGGYSEAQCKLRQAISIAVDWNQMINIFQNGRGTAAQGPIPPGIFGAVTGEKGTNPFTDVWNPIAKRNERRSIEVAKKLMAEAGYPNGIGPDNRQLVLKLQHGQGGDATFKSIFQWLRQCFDKIGIDLQEDASDGNRYRDRLENGDWQMTMSGWMGDYPDPETFLFLFYSPQGKRAFKGQNLTNYASADYDKYFKQFESMKNCPKRFELIQDAVNVLRHDAPICFGYFRSAFSLVHGWIRNYKPNPILSSSHKYRAVDTALRISQRAQWNIPRTLPVMIAWGIILLIIVPPLCVIAHRYQKAEDAINKDYNKNNPSSKKGA